jgi:hypothetical protein
MVIVIELDGVPQNEVKDVQQLNNEWKIVSMKLEDTRNTPTRGTNSTGHRERHFAARVS